MTQLLDRPAMRRRTLAPLTRPDYRRGHAPVLGLLVAMPCGAALWALLALVVYVLVR